MNYAGSAPVRQPVADLPEHDLPIAPGLEETPQGRGQSVADMRLLWERRLLLARVGLYGVLASTLIAFLIPTRYESTARLMPPDSNQTGGLAMAAAALSGGAGGLGSIASDMLGLKSTSDVFVGILSSRTYAAGTMYSGRCADRYALKTSALTPSSLPPPSPLSPV